MIAEERLDGPLNIIRFHNIERNQDFDTDWISDMSDNQVQEIVFTLHTYGYITYKVISRGHSTAYLCRLTPAGMKFCQEGGFKAIVEMKKKEKKGKLYKVVIAIISTIAATIAIIEFLSR